MTSDLTLGSLFDGSGGFPLGGLLCGMVPLWSSEIEPFAIRVTERRLPWMRHYGDVRTLQGENLEPVDVICFGSPCQNLSQAGKREGLQGEQSALFFEGIRIIREMRQATKGEYPRYAVWENVKGCLSSRKGDDFHAILEAFCQCKESAFAIPRWEKWDGAGEIVGEDFSICWRVLNAEHWGVPQRRKRVFLVADFRGHRARTLFTEPESLPWDRGEGNVCWQRTPRTSTQGLAETRGTDTLIYAISREAMNCSKSFAKAGSRYIGETGINATLKAVGPDAVAVVGKETSLVRKLTPTECGRLQGFPDFWCKGLESQTPTQEEILVWKERFAEYTKAMGKETQPKTDKQILRWLQHPNTDRAEYRLWGNGVALPCVYFVLSSIAGTRFHP